jgi:serine/threonine-protein kinase
VPPEAALVLAAKEAAFRAAEAGGGQPVVVGEASQKKAPVWLLVMAAVLGVMAALALGWAITRGDGAPVAPRLWNKVGDLDVPAGGGGSTTSPSPSTSTSTSTTTSTTTSTRSSGGKAGAAGAGARRREPGIVNVVTPGGWADIYVRGRKVGRSPGRIELPAGRHTVTLRPFGDGRAISRTVRVGAGDTERLSVPVQR